MKSSSNRPLRRVTSVVSSIPEHEIAALQPAARGHEPKDLGQPPDAASHIKPAENANKIALTKSANLFA
jgi:hypothetical protein